MIESARNFFKKNARDPLDIARILYYNIVVSKNAGVTQWQSVRFPSRIRGFDSRHLLHNAKRLLVEPFLYCGAGDPRMNHCKAPAICLNLRKNHRIITYIRMTEAQILVLIPVAYFFFKKRIFLLTIPAKSYIIIANTSPKTNPGKHRRH